MKIFNVAEFKPSMCDHWIAWNKVASAWPDDSEVEGSAFIIEILANPEGSISLHYPNRPERDEAMKAFLDRWREA